METICSVGAVKDDDGERQKGSSKADSVTSWKLKCLVEGETDAPENYLQGCDIQVKLVLKCLQLLQKIFMFT